MKYLLLAAVLIPLTTNAQIRRFRCTEYAVNFKKPPTDTIKWEKFDNDESTLIALDEKRDKIAIDGPKGKRDLDIVGITKQDTTTHSAEFDYVVIDDKGRKGSFIILLSEIPHGIEYILYLKHGSLDIAYRTREPYSN